MGARWLALPISRTTVKEDIGTNPLCDNRDMVFINDIALTQVDTLSKVGPGTFYVDYAADKLYIGTDPSTGRVESTRYDSPIMRKTPTGESSGYLMARP